MKVAAFIESPLRESLGLAGIDQAYRFNDLEDKELDSDIGLVIVPDAYVEKMEKKYPEKIIVGV